jgi:hypothetical protein
MRSLSLFSTSLKIVSHEKKSLYTHAFAPYWVKNTGAKVSQSQVTASCSQLPRFGSVAMGAYQCCSVAFASQKGFVFKKQLSQKAQTKV